MFNYESRGMAKPDAENGFFLGRMYQDITIELWKKDLLDGLLFIPELLDDGYEPAFLAEVLR